MNAPTLASTDLIPSLEQRIRAALLAEAVTVPILMPEPPARWQAWRARRRAAAAAMDLGYRVSPASYRRTPQ